MSKILVVDNDEMIRLLFHEEFTWEGYEVITAHSTRNAFEIIEQERPDLVVTEVLLEEENGLDFLQDIRNAYYNLPVVLCTVCARFKFDARAIAADHYVVKSSNLGELKRKVRMALDSLAGFDDTEAVGWGEGEKQIPIS
jgi:DNA-binding response OmpR family regulator